MNKKVIIIIIVTVLLIPFTAQAQDDLVIDELVIDIWPEFDKPTALVLYNITLSPDTPLPANLTFQLPISVGEPNGFGYYTDTSQLPIQNVEGYNYQVNGDFATVTFRVDTLNAHLEYYDPDLSKDGSSRSFEFKWAGDYAVNSLIVLLQQPFGANNVTTNPSTNQVFQGNKGLMVHAVDLGSVSSGETHTVSLSYEKDTDRLSIDGLSVEPVSPIDKKTPGRVNIVNFLPWGLGILGILLLGGGAWWYWQTGREKSRPAKRSPRKPAHQARQQKSSAAGGEIYCHQCGKRAGGGDRFCRSCGSKLRVP